MACTTTNTGLPEDNSASNFASSNFSPDATLAWEAKVVGYIAGGVKYEGKLDALLLEAPDGIRFKLGTGFFDEERVHPPKIGAWATYRC